MQGDIFLKNALRQRITILLARAFTRWPTLGRRWSKAARIAVSADVPWTRVQTPLSSSYVCLITTGGLHLKTDEPFNMDDPQGDPTFRLIPASATQSDLIITHNYYNHADADRDFNVLLPLDRVRELAKAGFLAGLTPTHYSFMGHIDGPHVATLENVILPSLIERIKAEHPDFVLLTPA